LQLLAASPLLLLFACREHLVFQIGDIPALRSHFDSFASFDRFRDVVVDCMDEVRMLFATHLQWPSSSPLCTFMKSRTPLVYLPKKAVYLEGDFLVASFFNHLNAMLQIYHNRILDFAYKRPNSAAMSVIRRCEHNIRSNLHEHTCLLTMTPLCICMFSMATSKNAKLALPLVPMPGWEEPIAPRKAGDNFDFRPFVPAWHLQVLEKAVSAALRDHSEAPARAFFKVLDVLKCCGLSPVQTQAIKTLVQDLQTGAINAKEYKKRFKNLRNNCPHGYNLIQAIIELVRERQRIRVICQLSSDCTAKQIAALERRYGCTGMDELPQHSALFYYCHVCEGIYSLLRDFSASYINSYRHGLRDADVSYLTNDVFCGKGKKNHRGECGVVPLKKIPLLGIFLFFCGKKIMLCPQPDCGLPMVLDPRQTIYNEAGPLCYDCCFKARIHRADYNIEFVTRCVLCETSPQPDKMFLFPHGAMVCNRCMIQHPRLKDHFSTPDCLARCRDLDATKKEIIAYRQMRRQIRVQRSQKQWTQAAKQSRARTRSNKK
jgi:hypothetical protein